MAQLDLLDLGTRICERCRLLTHDLRCVHCDAATLLRSELSQLARQVPSGLELVRAPAREVDATALAWMMALMMVVPAAVMMLTGVWWLFPVLFGAIPVATLAWHVVRVRVRHRRQLTGAGDGHVELAALRDPLLLALSPGGQLRGTVVESDEALEPLVSGPAGVLIALEVRRDESVLLRLGRGDGLVLQRDDGAPEQLTAPIWLSCDGDDPGVEVAQCPALVRWIGNRIGLLDGARVYETVVRVGDRVEVEGELIRELAPHGYRDQPTERLGGRPGRPLLVRRLG